MTRNMPALRRMTGSLLLGGWLSVLCAAALWLRS